MLGVLGGMGPVATADFFAKLLVATPASRDEDHIPTLVHSVPQIPSRPAAILRGGPSPLPALLGVRDRLIAAGGTMLAMPCQTAHRWHAGLLRGLNLPFPHIADAVASEIPRGERRIGIIATAATLAAEIYPQRGDPQAEWIAPPEDEFARVVQPAIDAVKRNDTAAAGRLLEAVVSRALERGSGCVVLACTEIPVGLDAVASPLRERCIDSTAALARC